MDSHNTKTRKDDRKAPVEVETDLNDVQVLSSTVPEVGGLAIADDPDFGCDPYNSTGSHVILKPKKDVDD